MAGPHRIGLGNTVFVHGDALVVGADSGPVPHNGDGFGLADYGRKHGHGNAIADGKTGSRRQGTHVQTANRASVIGRYIEVLTLVGYHQRGGFAADEDRAADSAGEGINDRDAVDLRALPAAAYSGIDFARNRVVHQFVGGDGNREDLLRIQRHGIQQAETQTRRKEEGGATLPAPEVPVCFRDRHFTRQCPCQDKLLPCQHYYCPSFVAPLYSRRSFNRATERNCTRRSGTATAEGRVRCSRSKHTHLKRQNCCKQRVLQFEKKRVGDVARGG